MEAKERTLAEDLACPVEVTPGVDQAVPEGWAWKRIGASQPNRATFHLSHSDVSRVIVDVLRPSDSPPDAHFVLAKEVPIIIIDSLDTYWAGESRTQLPLHGIRVPVEGDTVGEAKRALASDLAAQLRLLLVLSASHGQMSPHLQKNLANLLAVLDPRPRSENQPG
jgi:hypothetical protein